MRDDVFTCQGLFQSKGIGKAPIHAPNTVKATVIWRQVSQTDIALRSKAKTFC